MCTSREEGRLPPRSRRSCASTTTCRRRRLSSSSTNTSGSSVCVSSAWRMVQSRLRGEWQGSRSRHHHYPIPPGRVEARRAWQRTAGHGNSSTCTPMIHVACSADRFVFDDASVLCIVLLHSATTVFDLMPPMTSVKPNPDAIFGVGISSENGPFYRWRPTRKQYMYPKMEA